MEEEKHTFIFSSCHLGTSHSWPKMSSLIKGFPSCLALAHHKSQSKKNSKIIGFFLVQRNESPKNGAFFQEWIRGGEHLCQGLHASLFIHCILPNTITIYRGHHHYHQSIAVMIDIVISWNILYWYPGLGGWHDLLSGRRPHPDDGKPCGPGNILYFHIHNFHISRFYKYCISGPGYICSSHISIFLIFIFPAFDLCRIVFLRSAVSFILLSFHIFHGLWKLSSPFDIIIREFLHICCHPGGSGQTPTHHQQHAGEKIRFIRVFLNMHASMVRKR